MRVGTTRSLARDAYYDRAPLTQAFRYLSFGIAPHAIVDRWSYTVPANRRAIVATMQATLCRDLAPGAAGLAQSFIWLDDVAQANTSILEQNWISAGLTAGLGGIFVSGPAMQATEVLAGRTVDTSTGGTFGYLLTAVLTEFDA